MKNVSDKLLFAASDLSSHLSCSHSTRLDHEVARGVRATPQWQSPDLWVLQERGRLHEDQYIKHLKDLGLSVEDLRVTAADQTAAEATRNAMRKGIDVIVQATFTMDRWYGRADVLRRVDTESALGLWSYEVYDCKLSTETKAGTILQLSLYSEMAGTVQGLSPVSMYVVPPSADFAAEQYRVLDYAAYYRSLKRSLEHAVSEKAMSLSTYPEPVEHCDICAWFTNCDSQRRRDDHLSLVAGISTLNRKQLKAWTIHAVADLASMPLPLQEPPKYSSAEAIVRVREQARIQVEGRDYGKPVHELLTMSPDHGFCGLPEPSPGDMFFDLEGDPYIGKAGREYLFGFTSGKADQSTYQHRWSLTADEEKRAFEWFVDEVMKRRKADPDLHVYHFTAYEPSALKRLMGRYATRESQIDQLLRSGIFIDLHTILKRSLRASVENYSLKALEAFHGYLRKVPLEEARIAMRAVQHGLELDALDLLNPEMRAVVAGYNADDCFSTQSLRDWLENQRRTLVEEGAIVPRPEAKSEGVTDTINASQNRTDQLVEVLLRGMPTDPETRTEEQVGTQLLADLLDWHRRESKVAWWEFFRLRDLTDDELLDEKAAVSGLRFVARLSTSRGIPTDRYEFDRQETEVRVGDKLCHKNEKVGETVAIDLAARTLDLKKTRKSASFHPSSLFVDCTPINTQTPAESLVRLAELVVFDGIDAPGPLRAARDLILRRLPRIGGNGLGSLRGKNESTVSAAKRLVCQLSNSVLPIQGPPGAGKTFTGASMIVQLVKEGKRVGVTATSHAVVKNLLDAVVKVAAEENMHDLKCLQRIPEKPEIPSVGVDTTTDNAEARLALRESHHVLGGTAWLWSSKEFKEAVDVLFVDEAGQMALANVLAASQSARNLVLLGDPQQLEQPLKGTHPDGAEASALEHLLGEEKTVSTDRGLFLEETWRLHPSVCAFTSEVFYDNRLRSHSGLEKQRIIGHPWLEEAGLWFVPVHHEGNRNTCSEEVELISEIVHELLSSNVQWEDEKRGKRAFRLDDILVVAPYNAQVSDLAERLPVGIRVGTVDKFQGQEAPVVIYSLTTSSPQDAPRGMEFLYSLNRLNVATSRAKAMVVVLGSSHLLAPDCRNPRQIQLANALCRYVELARTLHLR